MKLPLEITYRNMESSEAVENEIRKWAEKLDRVCPEIMRCRVVLEAPSKHKQKGGHYHTTVDITVPGTEIVTKREPDPHHSYVDLQVSLRDAFSSARRQLEDYVRRRQGQVKSHEVPPHGHISELVPLQDYGRIATSDGRDIYFHRNSVVNGEYDRLEVGMAVRFSESRGDQGPQASSVQVLGKSHPVG